MLCAQTPATLLLGLSVAANAAITDAHVALALHGLARQGSRRGAGRAKLKRSFAPLCGPPQVLQRSHVSGLSRDPGSRLLSFRVLHAAAAGEAAVGCRIPQFLHPRVLRGHPASVCDTPSPMTKPPVPGPMGDNWRAGGFHKRATPA